MKKEKEIVEHIRYMDGHRVGYHKGVIQTVLIFALMFSVVILLTSCVEPQEKWYAPMTENARFDTGSMQLKSNPCDSCYQIQEINLGNGWTVLDTVFAHWHIKDVPYTWFTCGMDTTAYSSDSIVRNRMWCQ